MNSFYQSKMLGPQQLAKLARGAHKFRAKKLLQSLQNRLFSDTVNEKSSVCIVGGGMVGLYAALAFGKSPLLKDKMITLVDGGPNQDICLKSSYSNRVVAISPETRRLFSEVGIWERIKEVRYNPVRCMQVWEDQSDAYITFEDDNMMSDMAYIVENSLIMHALKASLSEMENVRLLYGRQLKDFDRGKPHSIDLLFCDGTQIEAQLLVGCDGFNSTVRRLANIHTLQWKHNQKAIVATLKLDEEGNDDSIAWQRFLKTGPVAFLPLDSRTSSLVWSTTPEEADRLMGLNEERFVDDLNAVMTAPPYYPADPAGSLLTRLSTLVDTVAAGAGSPRQLPPKVTGIGDNSRATFPLGFMHASNYVSPRIALLGDAAHRILPLAGQGVNLGFGDVSCLLDKQEQCLYDGQLIGEFSYLRDYETERQRFVVPVAATIETLYRLYATSFAPAVLCRSIGLQATNSLPGLKKFIVDSATSGKLSMEL